MLIIVGFGDTGKKILDACKSRHKITVVDRAPAALQELENMPSVHAELGDGSDIRTLTRAGIKNCTHLFAVTGSDHVNVLTTFMALELFQIKKIYCRLNSDFSSFLLENLDVHVFGANEPVDRFLDPCLKEGP